MTDSEKNTSERPTTIPGSPLERYPALSTTETHRPRYLAPNAAIGSASARATSAAAMDTLIVVMVASTSRSTLIERRVVASARRALKPTRGIRTPIAGWESHQRCEQHPNKRSQRFFRGVNRCRSRHRTPGATLRCHHNDGNNDQQQSQECCLRPIKARRIGLLHTPGKRLEPQHRHQPKVAEGVEEDEEPTGNSGGSNLGPGHSPECLSGPQAQCSRHCLTVSGGSPQYRRYRKGDIGNGDGTEKRPARPKPIDPLARGRASHTRQGKKAQPRATPTPPTRFLPPRCEAWSQSWQSPFPARWPWPTRPHSNQWC